MVRIAALVIAGAMVTGPTANAAPEGIGDAITAAGGTCQMGQEALHCTLGGITFQIVAGWAASTAVRAKACSEGFINARYQVLTVGDSMILTDHNSDLAAIGAALSAQGVQSELQSYCP